MFRISEFSKRAMMGGVLAASVLLIGCGEEAHRFDSQNVIKANQEDMPSQDDHRPVLRIAVASMVSPEITHEYYKDLLRLIGDRVGRRVVFSQRRTYAEVNALLKKSEIDMAFICSGAYVKGHASFGLELLVAPVSHGKKEYYSYIITRTNEAVSSFDELRGKRFAFTDPDSNSGCLVPTYMLAQRGETPKSFFSDTFFSESHDASIRAVASELTDAAAVNSLTWKFIQQREPELAESIHVVEQSPPFAMPPVVVSPSLNPALKAELKEALLTLHEDEKAVNLLKKLQIDRFEEIDDDAYEAVRTMHEWLKERDR